MSNSSPYPKEQQIHCLSFISNPAFMLSMPTIADLQTYVTNVVTSTLADPTIQSFIGTDWTAVWGPFVVSEAASGKSPVVVDNGLGLFYSPSQNLFVVSIAGTNANSVYDWMDEDFGVDTIIPWQTVLGTGGLTLPAAYANAGISTGMNTGLQIMLGMKDNNGDTMLEKLTSYCASNSITNAEVAVAGHSLGGSLTPVMALYMHDIQQNSGLNWNAGNPVTVISAWPTAGPTPGESVFASYYESLVNTTSFQYYSKYNPLDVVPQAWAMDTMQNVPTLYDADITPSPSIVLGPLVAGGMMKTVQYVSLFNINAIDYTAITPRTVLTGSSFQADLNNDLNNALQIYSSTISPSNTSPFYNDGLAFNSFICFLVQMVMQHTYAYQGGTFSVKISGITLSFPFTSLLGIDGFTAQYDVIKANTLNGTNTSVQHQEAMTQLIQKYLPGFSMELLAKAKKATA